MTTKKEKVKVPVNAGIAERQVTLEPTAGTTNASKREKGRKKKTAVTGRGENGTETMTTGPGVTETTTKDGTAVIVTTVIEVVVIREMTNTTVDDVTRRLVGKTKMEGVEPTATQPLR